MFQRLGFKGIVIFLVGIVAGGIIVFIFSGEQSDGNREPDSAQKGRPEWLAAPQVEVKEALGEKPAKPRALIVGVIGPLSGDEAHYGEAVLTGISIAADRFNSLGGFRGKAIKIISHDNSGGSDQALEITSALIRKNVVAIFSAPTGWSTFAPTHMANQSKTVFISIGTRRKIGRSGGYIFRLSLPDEIAIDELLAYTIKSLGYRNVALVTSSSYDYSLDLAAVFKQKLQKHGGKILVETDTYDTFSGKSDIGKVAAELSAGSEKLQAIIFTGDVREAAQLAKANRELGLNIPMIGSEDLFDEQFLKRGGEAVKDSLIYTTFAPDRESQMVNDFLTEHMARKSVVPDRFAALAFDAFFLLTQALENADSLESEAVRNALLDLKETEGITGESHWAPDGTPIKYPYFYRVEGSPAGEKFVLIK